MRLDTRTVDTVMDMLAATPTATCTSIITEKRPSSITDGTERVVEYSSDKHNGFQAHVKRVGHAHHPEVYGHHEGGHSYGGHGHRHASSYANGNLYQYHH
uniref:Uncharacterized protein n=1 Tax=Anopheles minimus TaxID=112268 RepID=A0A182WBB0_9DIPT